MEPVFIRTFHTRAEADAFVVGLVHAGVAPLTRFEVVDFRDRFAPLGHSYEVHGPPEAQPAATTFRTVGALDAR